MGIRRGAIQKLIRNPSRIIYEVAWWATILNKKLHRRRLRTQGIEISKKDWETLVILDAFRFDYFEDVCSLEGDLTVVTSQGSQSLEFLKNNFSRQTLHDTVLVSANPFTSEIPFESFHDVIPIFEFGWDDDLDTVPPDQVTAEAISVHQQYPNKRIIVHYMQPHLPFLANTHQRLNDHMISYGALQRPDSQISDDEFRAAYRENCQIALNAAKSLLSEIEGKVVITSDHGELLGERLWPIPVKGYEHMPGLRYPELVRVPWFETIIGQRREIIPEEPVEETPDTSKAKEHLKALGYL